MIDRRQNPVPATEASYEFPSAADHYTNQTSRRFRKNGTASAWVWLRNVPLKEGSELDNTSPVMHCMH